jgi:hypothetical protein
MMMNTNSLTLVMATLVGIAGGAQGQTSTSAPPQNLPILKTGLQIQVGGKPLIIGHTASPEVLDWNNDGKKDLLVGTFNDGKVMLFLNRGTDAEPRFDQGQTLQAGGTNIRVGFG